MRSQIIEVNINKQHLVYGIVALVLVAVLGAWTFFGNPVVWKWDGQWHIQKRATKDYHKFYPEAKQIEYVSATSGGEPVGYDNVSLSNWMGIRCQDASNLFVGLKLMQHINPLTVANQLGYTVGGVDDPIRVDAYGVPDKTLLNGVPDSVMCTVTFKGHTYSRTIPYEAQVDKQRPLSTLDGFTADTKCSAVNETQVDITLGDLHKDGTRDAMVSGLLMTDQISYDYNAELVETGNRTQMLVLSTDASRVQPLSSCIIKGAPDGQSGPRTHFSANLSLNMYNVDNLYVYHNGKRIAASTFTQASNH